MVRSFAAIGLVVLRHFTCCIDELSTIEPHSRMESYELKKPLVVGSYPVVEGLMIW